MEHTLSQAQERERRDPLAGYRDQFAMGDQSLIYMDGNSLGRPPKASLARMQVVLHQEWSEQLIRGWTNGWYEAPARVGEKIAGLVGAGPGQLLVSDATTVNLFKLVVAALKALPDRGLIVSDTLNFPSDLYVLEGCIELLGNRHRLILIPSEDDISVDSDTVLSTIDERVALVVLSHVTFKSGFLYDIAAITERAHAVGALVLWDLSHSVGVTPIELDRWNVDLAVGCTYKYLNGGPGAPAFLYVRKSLQEQLRSPIWGWFGRQAPFSFGLDYIPAPGVARFLAGTPPILALAALEPALDLVRSAGIARIREKSMALTGYCIELIDALLTPFGCSLGTPRDAERRGSHVSLRHPEGYRIVCYLIDRMSVLPDFREPDNIRLGFSPLYTSFTDVWTAVDRIRQVLAEGRYLDLPQARHSVT